MGMYTEFHFNSELKKDNQEIIDILKYMLGEIKEKPNLPEHKLFQTDGWSCMLRSDSYYFDEDTHSTLKRNGYDECYLCIRCNLKNYDSEIEKFIDWISPYLEKSEGEFLGFYRYEETEIPTLIYYNQENKNLKKE